MGETLCPMCQKRPAKHPHKYCLQCSMGYLISDAISVEEFKEPKTPPKEGKEEDEDKGALQQD